MQNEPSLAGFSLGAAIIVKNAEQDIGRALRSLQPVVRQMVVVDTGSADSTPVAASRLGAELYFFEWQDDFSLARNFALDHIRTDWVIALDADEELDLNSFAENLHLFSSPACGGIRTRIINVMEGKTQSEHSYTRIFRNDRRIRYEGRIHEQIAPSIERAGLLTIDSGIIIRHFGYAHISEEKVSRNAGMLKSGLRENPDDVFLQYHLGLTEFAAGKFDESAAILTAIGTDPRLSAEQQETVSLRLAQIALAQDRTDDALRQTEFRSNDTDREGLRLFIRGAAEAVRKNFPEALRNLSAQEALASRMVDQSKLEHFLKALRAVVR